MTNRTTYLLFALFAFGLFALAACQLLTGAAGAAGVPGAATPAAQQAAVQVDASIWHWLGSLLGVDPETAKVGTAAVAGAGAKPTAKHAARLVASTARRTHRAVKAATQES